MNIWCKLLLLANKKFGKGCVNIMMIQQVKKQQRHEQILLSLDNLTYATQQQLQVINKLGGDRNAHRILHDMEKDKIISSIRTERKIYLLSRKKNNNKKGKKKTKKRTNFIELR